MRVRSKDVSHYKPKVCEWAECNARYFDLDEEESITDTFQSYKLQEKTECRDFDSFLAGN